MGANLRCFEHIVKLFLGHHTSSLEDIRAIVVAPATPTNELPVPESVTAGFTQDICDGLRAAGWNVLPTELYDSIWTENLPKGGGLIDPLTTLKYDDRAGLVHRRTIRTLIEEYGADGFLYPEIQIIEAEFKGNEAEWDGVSQESVVDESSTVVKVAFAILSVLSNDDVDAFNQTRGSLKAVSLAVRIENTFGAMVYTKRGGIELLEGVDSRPDPWRAVTFPLDQIFNNPERNREAVRLALEPLRRGG